MTRNFSELQNKMSPEAQDKSRTLADADIADMESEPDTAPPTYAELLQRIDWDTDALYKMHREFTPMYPWCALLVLSKEQVLKSGIILPGHEQNKPMYEGIVLSTWKEKWIETGTINKDGVRLTKCKLLRSQLQPGDHVLFHHWAGNPIHGYDDQRFRCVREEDWHENKNGGIVGIIRYNAKTEDPIQHVIEMVCSGQAVREEDALVAAKIRARYVVIDKDTQALTLSGA